ncbi:MAG: DUF5652 family protein [Candidatus Paceibacterota bacterium]|jgi:methionyl-tRNA synthetase
MSFILWLLGSIIGRIILLLVLAWSFIWKGLALWSAAREGSVKWFVAILLINTLGILEIIYLAIFAKETGKKS